MEETQPIVNPDVAPEIQVKPITRPWFRIALFTCLGLILVNGLVFTGYHLGKRQIKPPILPTPTSPAAATLIPTPTTVVTLTHDLTTDWKTYMNTEYGFLIKYLPDWFFKDKEYLEEGYKMVRLGNFPSLDQEGCSPEEELFPSLMEITIDENKNRLPLKEWFDGKYECKGGCAPSPPEFLKNIVIGNKQGILAKWDLPGPLGEETKIYFFSHGETVYGIHLYYPPVSDGVNKREVFEKTFNLMLSTFRFLE